MKKVGRKSQKSKLKSKTKRKITTKQTTLNTVATTMEIFRRLKGQLNRHFASQLRNWEEILILEVS